MARSLVINKWVDLAKPLWDTNSMYRVKPESKSQPYLGDTVKVRGTTVVGMITACDLKEGMLYVVGHWYAVKELEAL